MAGIYKAYDVRGIYGKELTEDTARRIGYAFRVVLDPADLAHGGEKVVVSRDMRPSSLPLAEALIEGLTASGLDVVDIGLATTPANYFAIGHLGAAGGIQVTASHNPAEYNGLKFSKHEARPVSGDHGIPLIEATVASGAFPEAGRAGRVTATDVAAAYRAHVLSFLHRPAGARRLRVVVDAANGMAVVDRPIFDALGVDLIPLYFELDGTFPNHEANPLKLENLRDLQARVRQTGADLGVACDGDFDRAAFVDETGAPVGSDLATALIAGELLAAEPGKHVLYDLRSSRAVPEYIRERGGVPVRERVGHSFMKATLRRVDGLFGGELAGHYYFRDNYFADCAVLAVIEILDLLWRSGKTMSQVVAPLRRYAKSPETNFEVEDKAGKMKELEGAYAGGRVDWLDGITVEHDDWWFNVRPSNTEPLLRLVCEARTEAMLAARMNELVARIGAPVHH
ncbi:MAG: phosphomannomutase/phosphoglucomutase [Thermoanaerobaculia bacterium]|nr:MAG: phosphomannomutase/phosphoglucomutase [Thermoanaerobaculia bacterium]